MLSSLKHKIAYSESLQKVLRNIGWQTSDKIVRMGLGILVSVWTIRYLGPEQFGTLSYSLAFAGVFSALASLGLDGIVVREVSKDPSKKDVILGTAFSMKILGAIGAFLITVVSIYAVRPGDYTTIVMTSIVAFSLFFAAWDVIDFWFQSRIESKFTVFARNSAFIIAGVAKVLVIILRGPLIAFAIASLLEVSLAALGLVFFYRRKGNRIVSWKSDYSVAKVLLMESWPLIIAGFATFIYVKIDQLMLGSMLGNKPLGIYSAAIKFSEIWYFIPVAISSSVFPIMVEQKKRNEGQFFLRFGKICSLMSSIGIGIAIIMTAASSWLVRWAYGSSYSDAGPILAIHIWAGVFVFIGVAASIWTMIEGYQKFSLFATVTGGIINVVANLVLIPIYGGIGAAISTVVAYAAAGYFVYFLLPQTRKVAFMLTKSIIAPWKLLGMRDGEIS